MAAFNDQPTHGALDHAELAALGLDAASVLDYSSNLNPFGPPPNVRAVLAALDPAPYPDRSCHRLRQVFAGRHGCTLTEVLLGNGANELIALIARVLLAPGARALVVGPSYGEYAHASRLAGAEVSEFRAHPDAAFRLDADVLCAAVARLRPILTWLCTPNNPTGVELQDDALHALAACCAAHGGWLLVDGSYAEMRRCAGVMMPAPDLPATIWLYSLTKSHALAGLRLGYLIAEAAFVARIAAFQPTWSVNSAAQAAGIAALADSDFLAQSVPQLWAASDALLDGLSSLGLHVWRAALPFLLVRTGDGAATRAALLQRGCVVRDCASFGLAEWVRVAPRRPAENQILLAAWRGLV
jgi:threonine-phosphate decarboxylase